MLDPASPTEERVEEVGDVTHRIDVRDVRLEALVDDDAVVELDPAALEEVGDGVDSDSDDGHVRVHAASVLRRYGLEPAVSVERIDLVSENEVDSLPVVERRELVAQLLDAQLVEEPAAEMDLRHLLAELAQ